jgi:copper homeostasis protein (lipoprotein)
MKKLIFFFFTAAIAFSACNFSLKAHQSKKKKSSIADPAKKNPDLTGVYLGIMPCADCSGIKTEIRLNRDSTYETAIRYLGKPMDVFLSRGHFKWNNAENKIILKKGEGFNITSGQFLVHKDTLIALNSEGKRFQGTLPPNTFMYHKIRFNDSLAGKCWRLIELDGQKIIFYKNLKRIPHFTLNPKNKISGTDGCNTFIGHYQTLQGNRIEFSKFISTKMACLDAPYQKEFVKMLGQINYFSVKRDTLVLCQVKMKPVAKFVNVYVK